MYFIIPQLGFLFLSMVGFRGVQWASRGTDTKESSGHILMTTPVGCCDFNHCLFYDETTILCVCVCVHKLMHVYHVDALSNAERDDQSKRLCACVVYM